MILSVLEENVDNAYPEASQVLTVSPSRGRQTVSYYVKICVFSVHVFFLKKTGPDRGGKGWGAEKYCRTVIKTGYI